MAEKPQKVKVDVNSGKGFFNLWDIFKCIFVIFIMVAIYTKGNELIDKIFHKPETVIAEQMTEAQIITIASNLIQLTNQASQQRFEALMTTMKENEARYTNAADDRLRDALAAAERYAKQQDAQITSLGQTIAQMNTSFQETIASMTYVDEEKPSRSFEDYDLERQMSDGSTLPVGWAKYHFDWEGDDKLVQYHYPLDYYTKVIRTEKEDGTFSLFTEAWVQNDFVKRSKGIKYPLELKSVEFEERPIVDKKFRWNPRLGLGGGFTSDALFPQVDLSLASYGRTKRDMDWRFFTVGLGVAGWGDESDTVAIGTLSPAQYNLGNWLPMVENLFFGPAISISTDSTTGYGGIITVPF